MVLNHQTRMVNLLTRLGWQSRIAAHDGAKAGALPPYVRETAHELVDYMLFVDEAPLPSAGARRVGLYKGVSVEGAARQQRALAARPRPDTPAAALSVQLHDLYRCRSMRCRPQRWQSCTSGCGRFCRAPQPMASTRSSRKPIAAPLSRFCERRKKVCRRISRQREHPERVGGDNGDVLLAIATLVGDGVGVPAAFHLRHPQLPAGSRVERAKTIVVG